MSSAAINKTQRRYAVILGVSAVIIIVGIVLTAVLFATVSERGFSLSEFWALPVLVLPIALVALVVALIDVVRIVVYAVKYIVKTTLHDRGEMELDRRGEDSSSLPEFSFPPLEVKHRKFKIVFVVLLAAICLYCGVWSVIPRPLCYHRFIYSEQMSGVEQNQVEVKEYGFYTDIFGKTYYNYSVKNITTYKNFRIPLVSSSVASDDDGDYIEYTFVREFSYRSSLLKLETVSVNTVVRFYGDFIKVDGNYYIYRRVFD